MKPKQRKGFAVIPRERVREIASLGGKASHARGTAHEYTHAEAVAAGRKGGRVSHGGRGKDWKGRANTA